MFVISQGYGTIEIPPALPDMILNTSNVSQLPSLEGVHKNEQNKMEGLSVQFVNCNMAWVQLLPLQCYMAFRGQFYFQTPSSQKMAQTKGHFSEHFKRLPFTKLLLRMKLQLICFQTCRQSASHVTAFSIESSFTLQGMTILPIFMRPRMPQNRYGNNLHNSISSNLIEFFSSNFCQLFLMEYELCM